MHIVSSVTEVRQSLSTQPVQADGCPPLSPVLLEVSACYKAVFLATIGKSLLVG